MDGWMDGWKHKSVQVTFLWDVEGEKKLCLKEIFSFIMDVCVATAGRCPPIQRGIAISASCCISQLPSISLYRLEAGTLHIQRNYREDITALGRAREPGDDIREYRRAAYRSYIFWRHGAVGLETQLVIPSLYVWQIRGKWLDPYAQSTDYIPGHQQISLKSVGLHALHTN